METSQDSSWRLTSQPFSPLPFFDVRSDILKQQQFWFDSVTYLALFDKPYPHVLS